MNDLHKASLLKSLLIFAAILFGTAAMAQSGTEAAVHDRSLEEVGLLQRLIDALPTYPADVEKRPNWVELLRQGIIKPRETLRGELRAAEPLGAAPEAGVVFRNTLGMPHVVFPHRQHTEWLACSNCHDSLFERRQTGRGLGMEAILAGKHCGACHGRVAFSPEGSCYRCHSLPHPNMIQQGTSTEQPDSVDEPLPGDEEQIDPGTTKRRKSANRTTRKSPIYPARPQ